MCLAVIRVSEGFVKQAIAHIKCIANPLPDRTKTRIQFSYIEATEREGEYWCMYMCLAVTRVSE